MTRTARAAAIIPVRVQSQRLPNKALLSDSGQPLFLHTWEQARRAECFEEVYVATDSDAVADAATAAGAALLRTTDKPRTGSERCAEALASADLDVDIIVDVQGDWPEIAPDDLARLSSAVADGAPTAPLAVPLADQALLDNPNVVKVVRGQDGNALYFSRACIPHPHAGTAGGWLRHIGVYAFTREVLLRIPDLPSSGLAETEGLEQLRFLENGISMQVVTTDHEPWGIETASDYQEFLRRLTSPGGTRS